MIGIALPQILLNEDQSQQSFSMKKKIKEEKGNKYCNKSYWAMDLEKIYKMNMYNYMLITYPYLYTDKGN